MLVVKKVIHSKGTFVGYKWMNISVAKMYQFLGILLKMSLISLDVNSFKSLWYPLTHATISPTCQFEIKDYPSWTKWYLSYSRFSQIRAAFHPESETSQERDRRHQLRNAINTKQLSLHFLWERKCPLMRLVSQANQIMISSKNYWISVGFIFYSYQCVQWA